MRKVYKVRFWSNRDRAWKVLKDSKGKEDIVYRTLKHAKQVATWCRMNLYVDTRIATITTR